MFTAEELQIAIKVLRSVSNDPSSGVIKEILDALEKDLTAPKEVRVVQAQEKR